MGFTLATVAGVTNAAALAFTGYSQYQEGRAMKRAAAEQEKLSNAQAEAEIQTATRNQIYARRNANDTMAAARADAAASNLADEGSARIREVDLATRLEDEINNNTNAALQQADTTHRQGLLNAWNTRNMARQSTVRAVGSGIGSAGALIGAFSPQSNNGNGRR